MNEKVDWRKCSSCKKPIQLGESFYKCSVSTCNSKRRAYVFCSIPCFDQHIPKERHKSAGAIREIAPTTMPQETAESRGRRIIPKQKLSAPSNKQISQGGEVLVIASRFKQFVASQSDFNTSAAVMDVLSDHLRHVAMQAIDNARASGRKTVMDQDLKFLDKLNLNI